MSNPSSDLSAPVYGWDIPSLESVYASRYAPKSPSKKTKTSVKKLPAAKLATPKTIKMTNGSVIKTRRMGMVTPPSSWETWSERLRKIRDEEDNKVLTFLPAADWVDAPIIAPKIPVLSFSSEPKPKTIKTLAKPAPKVFDPHPHFLMGVEFEGVIRSSVREQFEIAMYDLGSDTNGDALVHFGKDSSIKLIPAGFESVEIRTKTLPIDQCIVLFEEMLCMFYLATELGDFKTNKTCGLHINISEPNVFHGKQVSLYCHVLQAFDEANALELFGRQACKHCKPFFDDDDDKTLARIEERYRECKRRESDIKKTYGSEHWVNEIDEAKASKYYSVALRDTPTHAGYKGPKLKDHRIEFRCIGNTHYHLRHDDLDATINHMLEVVNNAFYDVHTRA